MIETVITELVRRTPTYVWVVLVLVIVRGKNALKDKVLSFPKMLIFPAVFIVWGLETVVLDFVFPIQALAAYLVLAVLGTLVGYLIYRHARHFYRKDGLLYRSGTGVTLIVSLLNFIAKYALNVAMSIQPELLGNMSFNLLYAMIGGFAIGMSLGGVYQAYLACIGRALSTPNRGAEL